MKLYEVKPHTRIRVLDNISVPPAAPPINKGDELLFSHIDGMYSTCFNGSVRVYLGASAEVEIIE